MLSLSGSKTKTPTAGTAGASITFNKMFPQIQLPLRRLGRLRQRYWRANGAFEVKIEERTLEDGKRRLSVSWQRDHQWAERAETLAGCYLLRTNLTGQEPATPDAPALQVRQAADKLVKR